MFAMNWRPLPRQIWTKWREVPVALREDGGNMKSDYAAMVALSNEGARELGRAGQLVDGLAGDGGEDRAAGQAAGVAVDGLVDDHRHARLGLRGLRQPAHAWPTRRPGPAWRPGHLRCPADA